MNEFTLKESVLRTLLYYDIFCYPLNQKEVFTFLPSNSMSSSDVYRMLRKLPEEENSHIAFKDGFFFMKPNFRYVDMRIEKERYSRKMWKIARLVTHIIKRFPFVRSVIVTGSLSKNNSGRSGDLDFMVITENKRLWIVRTLLMLFKKVFLLNSYKYFCINYFITKDKLEIEEKNIYTATEIAHLKPTFNSGMMHEFIGRNLWIKNFFPNYTLSDEYLHSAGFRVNNRRSIVQKLFELFFAGRLGDLLDEYFLRMTSAHWEKKYSHINGTERNHMFKSTQDVSKTHPLNMQKQILEKYAENLKSFNLQ